MAKKRQAKPQPVTKPKRTRKVSPRGPRPASRKVPVPVEKYPGVTTNPTLARAVRIYYALQTGMSRIEAIEWVDEQMPDHIRAGKELAVPIGKTVKPTKVRTARKK